MKIVRLACGVAAAAMVGGVAMSASAADEVLWNFSAWGKPRAFTKGIDAMSEYLAEKSGGNFKLKIHYGEAISPSKENIDGIKIGSHEAAMMCTSYHPGKNPAGTVLDLPFLPISDLTVQAKVHEDFIGHPEFKKEMKRWNAIPIFSGILPQYEAMGVGDPPRSAADFKGLRVRGLGGIGQFFDKLGAVPTTVTASESYTALERGTIQVMTFPYSYAFGAYRHHEVAKWYTEGMALGSVFCPQIMSVTAYNALPDEYRALFNDDMKWNSYKALIDAYVEADKKWIPIYEKAMTRVEFTKEQHAEFVKIGAQPVWDEWVAANKDKLPAQELLDFVLERAAHHNKSA
ncbi:MAG: TRAP transporter substrate-binding protein DctP [Alphaproteobacteria bacterium]|nr:TRAP transporter substrate-binding protein DctP [Alphaproteobacteria bacterium]